MKLLYGLDALPRGMPLDDPRLPAITLDDAPLRLNTHPVPPAILAEAGSSHDSRVAALTAWLLATSGPWAAARRRRITDYIASITEEIACNHDRIVATIARYDGLYTPQDYFWSALRPLPRAWLIEPGTEPIFAGLAFWDGQNLLTTPTQDPFWETNSLPHSPFRRPLPPLPWGESRAEGPHARIKRAPPPSPAQTPSGPGR